MLNPPVISPFDQTYEFPDVSTAYDDPNGLLAIGGDLSPKRLISAYKRGIFPWFSRNQPILWWSPDPRMVLKPDQLITSRSLRKTIRKNLFHISYDQAFDQVIDACSKPRPTQPETWITSDMKQAYNLLHSRGQAHSFEAWQDGKLVGGLYGIAIGQVFFGESMFSTVSNASKVAFVAAVNHLVKWGYQLIDCQVESEHLGSLGAANIPRREFIERLSKLTRESADKAAWKLHTPDISPR